jgi:hypothetical protein
VCCSHCLKRPASESGRAVAEVLAVNINDALKAMYMNLVTG